MTNTTTHPDDGIGRPDPEQETAADFRMGPVEYVHGPDGRMVGVQVCAEYDAESDRWEPFVTIVKIVSDEPTETNR